MQTATLDPTAGETARRRSPYLEQAEQVGDPTDPRFHDPRFDHPRFDDPRFAPDAADIAPPPVASHTAAPLRPRIPATPRPTDRPLGSTHDHLGAAFLPADVRGDPLAGHVLGHSRETILSDGADADGRPAGHVLGHRWGEQPPPDFGRHVAGYVLGPVPRRAE